MFERILQEIHKGNNLVIDNEKIPEAIDSALLLDEINQSFMAFSIDLKEAIKYLGSNKEFAEYIIENIYSSLRFDLPENRQYSMSDIIYVIRKVVEEIKENPVFVINHAEAGIGMICSMT